MPRLPRLLSDSFLAAILAGLIIVCAGLASAAADEPGPEGDHLVVSSLPVAGNAQAVTLVRFSGSGVSDGGNWALPTSPSGADNRFTLEGNSNAVGAVALSRNGAYVTLAGYTQPLGTSLGGGSDTAPRVVARVDAAGNVDTSTTLGTSFTQEKIRGAVSDDGSGFWVTGHGNTANPKGGMVYAALGSSTPTVLFTKDSVSPSNAALNNTRTVQIGPDGNAYFGSEKGTAGIFRTTGLPTKAQAPVSVFSFGGDGTGPIAQVPLRHEESSAVDTMFVVQEGSGIYKFSSNGSSWTNRGKVASGSFYGLAAKVDTSGDFRLYTISGDAAGNKVVTVTDTAAYDAAPAPTAIATVATAAAGTAYRGIAFAPVDTSLPSAPSGVTGTAGNGKVTLSWSAPASEGASPISGYRITPYIAGVAQAPIDTGSTATSRTIEGLSNGTAYTFAVAAINAGGVGPASAQSEALTPFAPGAATPTISLAESYLAGAVGDPTNPTVEVTVGQAEVDASALSVEATASTNSAVAAPGGVSVSGSGATRTVAVTPAGAVGYADITLQVTGAGGKTATIVLHYAASAATAPALQSRYHGFAADASTALDVGDGYVLVGNDENNVIRLYRRGFSGKPVKTWDFNSQMGSPEEIDIEASARIGDTIFWTGSMGNSKKGNLKPDRSILFTTQVTGSGAATELSFGGYYRGLRADLIKWDEENGDRFGFADGAAAGNIPKQIDGFNVEGMEFAPGSEEVGYLGFRAPLSPATPGGYALIVPVTNLGNLATSGQNTSLHATFGEPILLDLDGLSIREIRRTAADEYMILAGSWAASGPQAMYVWVPGSNNSVGPLRVAELPAAEGGADEAGAYEAFASLPAHLSGAGEVRLLADVGATDLYGDGQEAKELVAPFQKSREDRFAFGVELTPVNVAAPTLSGTPRVGQTLTCDPGRWWGAPEPEVQYRWVIGTNAEEPTTSNTWVVPPKAEGKEVRCRSRASSDGLHWTGEFSNGLQIPVVRCDGADVSGGGSFSQAAAHQTVWGPAFAGSVCNQVDEPTVAYEPIGTPAAKAAWSFDGASGSLDTDLAFVATDGAPSAGELANVKAAAGGAAPVVVPVAQTAIAILANPPAGCNLEYLGNSNLAGVMEGRIRSWSKLETAEAGTPGACDAPITRVVDEGAGITAAFKSYLNRLYPNGLFCTTGSTEGKAAWSQLAETAWPESCPEKDLSPVLRPGSDGGPAVVAAVNATPGSIAYAALPDAMAAKAGGTRVVDLQNNGQRKAPEATYGSPVWGPGANCGHASYRLPSVGAPRTNWSDAYSAQPAVGGDAYPLCALTFVVALSDYSAAGFTEAEAVTVRDYLSGFLLRTTGQAAIANAYHAPLPGAANPLYDVSGIASASAKEISW